MRVRTRVGIVEDDRALLECLQMEINTSPGLKCVAAFCSFEEAAKELPKRHADVLLLDLGLPGADGVTATAELKKILPRLKVVIFSGHDGAEKILASFNAGADGYLLKTTPRQKLIEAIEKVYEGGSPISPRVADQLVDYFRRRTALFPHLSPTEKRVLTELESGETYKTAADKMGMSVNTLKTHVRSILFKTGAASAAQAAFFRRQALS